MPKLALSLTLPKALLCALFLALPVGFAQGFYFGVSVGTPLSSDADKITDFAELGAQLGYDLSTVGFGVRLAAEGNPLNGGFKLASADALFRYYLPLWPALIHALAWAVMKGPAWNRALFVSVGVAALGLGFL